MTIWIVALGLLVALGIALALASFVPLARRRREAAPPALDQPLFFERHRPPVRQPLPLAAEHRARLLSTRESKKS